jgi:peptide/nickel transport system substrate-binding protein
VSSERVDDLTVVFKLRQGVKFHNNEPFDANSMLFTRQRMLDPTSQASGTGQRPSTSSRRWILIPSR